MLDLQFIRDNPDRVKQAAVNKNLPPEVVDDILQLDRERRELMVKSQNLRAQRNKLNDELKAARTPELIEASKALKQELEAVEPDLKEIELKLAGLMLQVPNVTLDEVPVGPDETANVEIKTWGDKPHFDFKPKDHIALGESLGLVNLERGSKVSGYRGYFLTNQAVMLQFGLMRFALDKLADKGFTPMIPPIINRQEAFVNSGHFPWGEAEAYALESDQKLYLAGTAEVPLVSYHAGEILNEADLPLKYAGFSPCYRREIGNYGKDTKGIYRVHEFMKVEQVILCVNDLDESRRWHESLLAYAEELLQALNLHYRVLLMATGDMGEPQMKKYDIETWMPGRDGYGETMSNSIMGDFQARRANIRYRAKDGTLKFVHMLNNTALASTRILIALLESHQQADGSVLIPPALVPYVGFDSLKPQT
jgi:seryl-tRNA synthetase